MKKLGSRMAILFLVLAVVLSLPVYCQPKLATSPASSYLVGDRVDPSTLLMDRDMQYRPLAEIVQEDAQVVVLILFGGAAPSAPDYHPLRGGIWCPDSFDELPLQRALIRQFKDAPVQFIPVAVPPAYSTVYGFEEDVFTTRADDDPLYRSQVRTFIDLTEATRETDVLPFEVLYYDPKYRLAQDKEREVGPDYGPNYPWQSKFRWHQDPRKYGTPSIWVLDGDLKVARVPFTGNNYNDDPPQIRYGFAEVGDAIQQLLERPSPE